MIIDLATSLIAWITDQITSMLRAPFSIQTLIAVVLALCVIGAIIYFEKQDAEIH